MFCVGVCFYVFWSFLFLCLCLVLWMQEMQLDSEEWFSHEQHVRLVRISLRREGEDVMTLSFSNTSFRERGETFQLSMRAVRRGGSTTLCFISDRVCFGGSTFGWWQCCSGKGIIIISSTISFVPISNIIIIIPISNIISILIIAIHHHQGGASLGSGSSPITSQGEGGGEFVVKRVVLVTVFQPAVFLVRIS